MNNVKSILKDLILASSTHGLSRVIRNENWFLKIVLFLCFMASFLYLNYCQLRLIKEFLEFKVVTQITTKRVSSIEFPTVTFCNKNPYKTTDPGYRYLIDEVRKGVYNKNIKNITDTFDKLSQSEFPTRFYSDVLINVNANKNVYIRNFTSYEQVKSSTLALNVYYDDITYTIVDEVPSKTWDDFVANLGGFLGLCLGASLLSLVEIFEFVFKIISYYFNRNFQVKPKPKLNFAIN